MSETATPTPRTPFEYPEATRTVNGRLLTSLEYAEITADAHMMNGRDIPCSAWEILRQEFRSLRAALTLLAPDTRTEYDKAVDALAPYLPDGWVAQSRGKSPVLILFKEKPTIKDFNGDSWWTGKCKDVFPDSALVLPTCPDWRTSLRQIKSGKVVPHV